MKTRGFTLIEVLVALAILAVALAAAMRSATSSAQTEDLLRQKLLATWTAQNRLAEHRLLRDWPAVGRVEGQASMGGETLAWVETVSATPNVQFRRIDISVSAPSGGRVLVKLSGMLTAPGT